MKKRVLVAVIAIVVLAASVIGGFSIARASDKKAALNAARVYVPENAELLGSHKTDDEYSFAFFTAGEVKDTYNVTFNREVKAVTQVKMFSDNLEGATEATLSEAEAKQVVVTAHPTATVTECALIEDAQRYIYLAEYEAAECYGNMEIHAANGRVITSNMKMGTPIVIPIVSSEETYITEEQAIEIAQAKVEGGIIISCNFEYDDGMYVYEIEIRKDNTEYDLVLNARTGDEISFEIENADFDDDTPPAGDYITVQAAMDIALAKAEGDNPTITEIHIDNEDGIAVYEGEMIDSKYEYDFDINATTGEVLTWEKETVTNTPNPTDGQNTNYIGIEAAKEIVLAKAEGENARITEIHLDNDDGRTVYEGEMVDSKYEYDFDIDALTGEVVTWEKEIVDNTPAPTESGNDYIGTAKAKQIALAKAEGSNAKITEIHLDNEDGRTVYEGEMIDSKYEYDFDIDAITGEVVTWERETVDNTPAPTESGNDYIGTAKAKQIALAKAEGSNAKITEIHLENDDGRMVYEGEMIDSKYEYDFDIDAYTGKVLAWDKEAIEPTPTESGNEYIGITKAKQIALAKAEGSNAKIISIHLENDDGRMVYEGEMIDSKYEYEFDIDAYTGTILSWEKEAVEPTPTDGNNDYIGIARAKEIALAKAKGKNARIVEIELDFDDGRAVYEIEMVDDTYEYEITIDAYTGTIIEFDYEREDD